MYGRRELMDEIKRGVKVGSDRLLLVAFSLYIRPANGIIIKVEPCDDGHVDHWRGVRFEVFTRIAKVDSIFLPFDGLLVRAKDDRADYLGGLYILRSAKDEDWYIARPESIEPLIGLINDFLSFWGEQEH